MGKKYVTTFPSSSEPCRVVQAEFIAMCLAFLVRLNAAPVQLLTVANRTILLIERFDRQPA